MSIPYSLALRLLQPGKPEMGNKTFPVAQYAANLDLNALAQYMSSHNSKYNKGDVLAVATQLVDCVREQQLLGNRVSLGDLGTFYVSLKAEGSKNAEEFTTSKIERVNVRWAPSARFKNLEREASFTFVGSREAQAEARNAEIEALNKEATVQPDSGGGEDTGEDEGDSGLGD